MKKSKAEQKNASARQLRGQAEEKLASMPRAPETSSLNVDPLTHEFQIHQIELELQNEELRKAQGVIEGSRKKFSDLFNFAPIGYFSCNGEGVITEVNLTATELLENGRNVLVGRPLHCFVAGEDRDIFYRYWHELRSSARRQSCEIRLKRASGDVFYAQLVSNPGMSQN